MKNFQFASISAIRGQTLCLSIDHWSFERSLKDRGVAETQRNADVELAVNDQNVGGSLLGCEDGGNANANGEAPVVPPIAIAAPEYPEDPHCIGEELMSMSTAEFSELLRYVGRRINSGLA